MIKILFIPEFGNFGGTRTYFETFVTFCYQHKINLLVLLEKRQADKQAISFLKEKNCAVKYIFHRSNKLRNLWQRFPFNFIFDFFTILPLYLKERPNLVVVSNGTPFLYLGVAMFAKRFIYITHTYPVAKMSLPYRLVVKLFMDGKRKIILAVSEFAKKNIVKYCAKEKIASIIKVIYNTPVNNQSKLSATENNGDLKTILTIGHVEWYKNPDDWLKIAEKTIALLPNEKIEFIWAGSGALYDKYTKLINERHLSKIKFVGYQRDVLKFYKKCYIYFQPSKMESFGLSVAQAQMLGIPCVVSNMGALPELIKDEQNGLIIELENCDNAAKRIASLILDKARYDKFSLNSKKYFEENFSYKIWDNKMQFLINNICKL